MDARRITPRDHDRPAPPTLLAEAGAAIIRASIALRVKPFSAIASQTAAARRYAIEADAETAYWIRRAVAAWGRRVPWRAECFERALAADAMLRRRGFVSHIHYGAATRADGLAAHVWVTSGARPVVGHENREEFAELMRLDR